ncbi:MAG: ribosome-binding factor A [Alphaproteobacteria bacterium]|nr:ribosome-binding factor A [Alphaproteobacteria bacterium]
MKKQNNKSFARADRIEAKVQALVAEILREREIPVTLVGAESHGGLQFVRLYWQGARDMQKRLDAEKNTIRFELAQRMDQKYVPDLRFVYDDTLEKSERIDALLAGIEKELEDD